MALARSQRLALVEGILSVLDPQDGAPWQRNRINMMLHGFALAEASDFSEVPWYEFMDQVRRSIQAADDEILSEMASYVGLDVPIQQSALEGAADLWRRDSIRVFLTHSAIHKVFVGEVSESLVSYGIHGFVAHDSIEVTREWQAEIEKALGTCDVLVALVHPEILDSAWCHQEIGWALGRGIPIFCIRMGVDPLGFVAKKQWPSLARARPDAVALEIVQRVNSLPAFSIQIVGGLLRALRSANNYFDARDIAHALNEFDSLTHDQWAELDQIYLANDQVHGSVIAMRELRPLYERHNRDLPQRT